MPPIIEITNLSKQYRIGKREPYKTLRDTIVNTVTSPLRWFKRNGVNEDNTIWALKDVSFEVNEGEVLGIIGRNGAGKSTLLKILSRITEPTEGEIKIRGRVGSLLEVGTGFHPELTGRENIFLNGAILGMRREEIKKKFDEIVAFSEIEKFLDTPVKRYSSGMYVRLAFAVAAHLEPEVLVVDEVLAVGDAGFQKKCMGKMGEVAKGGRTVLFVSHNMAAVKSLCNSAILFSRGSIASRGTAIQVTDEYLNHTSMEGSNPGEIHWPDRSTAPGGKEMRLVSVRLFNGEEKVQGNLDAEKPVKVEITYEVFESVRNMGLVFMLTTSEGIVVFASGDHNQRNEVTDAGIYRSTCTIPGRLLNSGVYVIKVYSDCPGVKVLLDGPEVLSFHAERVFQHGALFVEKWHGVVTPKLSWETELIQK